jgi:hypothetical protein
MIPSFTSLIKNCNINRFTGVWLDTTMSNKKMIKRRFHKLLRVTDHDLVDYMTTEYCDGRPTEERIIKIKVENGVLIFNPACFNPYKGYLSDDGLEWYSYKNTTRSSFDWIKIE